MKQLISDRQIITIMLFIIHWSQTTIKDALKPETDALIDPSVIRTESRTEREIKRFSEIVNINASKSGNKKTQTRDGHNWAILMSTDTGGARGKDTSFNGGLMCRVRHRNCGVLSGVRQYVSYYASSINLMRNNNESNEQACSSYLMQVRSQENLMTSRTAAVERMRAQQMQKCNGNVKFWLILPYAMFVFAPRALKFQFSQRVSKYILLFIRYIVH